MGNILDRGKELLGELTDAEQLHEHKLKALMEVMDAQDSGGATDEDVDQAREALVAARANLDRVKRALYGANWRA